MAAIIASVHSTMANRVTAVPRRSLNVTPVTPAAACALRHEARNPSEVHGLPSRGVRMIVERLGVAIEHDLEWGSNLEAHSSASLRLLQSNALAVISRPRKPQ